MSNGEIKTRFAPSPTGYLHLGNVRTALFNVLFARHAAGVFLLRSEDTDSARSASGYLDALMQDLDWLGLQWQEGPGAGGAAAPYLQSERREVYGEYYRRLEERDRIYPCYCSQQELALERKQQLASKQPPRYSGKCASLSQKERQDHIETGRRPTLRFRVPPSGEITYRDLVRGEQRFRTRDIGDFVIRRADQSPAFFFANAIDDALMSVTHVLRGEDHIANTPRQLMLLDALGLARPHYGHISLILGKDGRPLSKRDGSRSIRELRAAGVFPMAINNHLARLGHHYADEAFMNMDALAAGFHLEGLSKAPAHHDEYQMMHWQKSAVSSASDTTLVEWLQSWDEHHNERNLQGTLVEQSIASFVPVVRENIETPADAFALAQRFFAPDFNPTDAVRAAIIQADHGFFEAALGCYGEGTGEFKEFADAVKRATGRKGKALFQPLRAALTNATQGPEMAKLFHLIPAALMRTRLEQAAELAGRTKDG